MLKSSAGTILLICASSHMFALNENIKISEAYHCELFRFYFDMKIMHNQDFILLLSPPFIYTSNKRLFPSNHLPIQIQQ